MVPYGAGYKGEIKTGSPHPRSYGAHVPLRPGAINWHNTAPEMRAYCRVSGIRATGPMLCKPIPRPSGSPVTGSPTLYLPGQVEAF